MHGLQGQHQEETFTQQRSPQWTKEKEKRKSPENNYKHWKPNPICFQLQPTANRTNKRSTTHENSQPPFWHQSTPDPPPTRINLQLGNKPATNTNSAPYLQLPPTRHDPVASNLSTSPSSTHSHATITPAKPLAEVSNPPPISPYDSAPVVGSAPSILKPNSEEPIPTLHYDTPPETRSPNSLATNPGPISDEPYNRASDASPITKLQFKGSISASKQPTPTLYHDTTPDNRSPGETASNSGPTSDEPYNRATDASLTPKLQVQGPISASRQPTPTNCSDTAPDNRSPGETASNPGPISDEPYIRAPDASPTSNLQVKDPISASRQPTPIHYYDTVPDNRSPGETASNPLPTSDEPYDTSAEKLKPALSQPPSPPPTTRPQMIGHRVSRTPSPTQLQMNPMVQPQLLNSQPN